VVQATQIVRDAPEGFSVMSGEDALNFPLIAIGGMGTISVTANVVPKLMSEHIETALSGDMKKAAEQHRHLQALNSAMFIETNPIPAKESLAMMGMIENEFRLPMCNLQAANREALAKVLRSYGLIK
jgi:4-hydroxy-tetrahydrodipicolinate synthase